MSTVELSVVVAEDQAESVRSCVKNNNFRIVIDSIMGRDWHYFFLCVDTEMHTYLLLTYGGDSVWLR